MQHADDIVEGASPKRQACMRALEDFPHHRLGRHVGIDRTHVGAVDHHVGYLELVELGQIEQRIQAPAVLICRIGRTAALPIAPLRRHVVGGPIARHTGKPVPEHHDQHQNRRKHCGDDPAGLAHPVRFSLRKESTSDAGTSLAMKALPMPWVRMKVRAPRETFLSWAMNARSASASGKPPGTSARRQGNPTSRKCFSTRVASSGLARFMRAENRCASAMPIATASPCTSLAPSYPTAASSAWPKVWPRLSSALSPVSNSSRATTSALARHDCAMASIRAAPPQNTSCQLASSQAKNSGRLISPYFAISA